MWMMPTERHFLKAMEGFFPDGVSDKRFLLAVSGGADSMVVLHLFQKHYSDFIIAHCNYGLRGTESDLDEALVNKMAKEYDKIFCVKHVSLPQKDNKSIQLLAREHRYDWFAMLKDEHQVDFVVTAHHLDDNTETLLFNLIRGTGIKGLCGIPAMSANIIRPLLQVSKSNILEYAQANGIQYRDDASNFSTKYNRNKIRLNILPEIEKINPQFSKTINEHIREYADLEELLREQTANFIKHHCRKDNDCLVIPSKTLLCKPGRLNILFSILGEYGFSKSQVEFLLNGQLTRSGTKIESGSHELYLHGDEWIVAPVLSDLAEISVSQIPATVHTAFGSLSFIVATESTTKTERDTLVFEHNFDDKALVIRTRKDGDRFAPEGMNGKSQKLKDFFINSKISVPAKARQLLLCSGDEIIWIVGLRKSHHTHKKVNNGTYVHVVFSKIT